MEKAVLSQTRTERQQDREAMIDFSGFVGGESATPMPMSAIGGMEARRFNAVTTRSPDMTEGFQNGL